MDERGESVYAALRTQPPSDDPIAKQARIHHDAISRNERAVLTMERDRDVTLRRLDAELAEATREFEARRAGILAQIDATTRGADHEIETRKRLIRSSQDALVALEPNQASQEAPMNVRSIPRREAVQVPIQVHKDIRT